MRSGVKKHHWLFWFDRILKVGWLLSKQWAPTSKLYRSWFTKPDQRRGALRPTLHKEWRPRCNSNQGIYSRSRGWIRKNLFNLPQVTSKFWTLWPCFGSQVATLGANVWAFINFLTSML
jgi:hypothetical protein